MNRNEFMEKLERLLPGLPVDEREAALQYYTDYFEDAGEEHEAEVISELGSPEKVAATIKADLKGGSSENGEFTENGYSNSRFEKKENPATREYTYKKAEGGYSYRSTSGNESYGGSSYTDYDDGSEKPRTSKTLKIILVILICLVVIPFAFPVLIGIVALIIGIVCAAFGLFAGLVVGSVALMLSGIVVFVFGLAKLLIALPTALLTCGSGLIIFVLGLIATVATVRLCMVIYPAMCRIIVNICRWPFHRRVVS